MLKGTRSSREAATQPVDPAALRELVEIEIAARELRSDYFAPALVNEPAWIVMTYLYQAQLEGAPRPVKDLCPGAGLSKSSVQRYLDHLEAAGLVTSETDPSDTRMRLARLTPEALLGMEQFYSREFHRQAQRMRRFQRKG